MASLAISDIVTLFSIFGQRLLILTGDYLQGFVGWCNINYLIIVVKFDSGIVYNTSSDIFILAFSWTWIHVYQRVIISLSTLWARTSALYLPVLFSLKPTYQCILVPGWQWLALHFRPLVQLITSVIISETATLTANVALMVELVRVKDQRPDTCTDVSLRTQDEPYNSVIRMCLCLGVVHLVTIHRFGISQLNWISNLGRIFIRHYIPAVMFSIDWDVCEAYGFPIA